jgi:hypothetical protein
VAGTAPAIDFREWLRLELGVAAAVTVPLAEVQLFSIPKLNLYAELLQEMKMREALLQSAAVWAPDKVSEQLDRVTPRAIAESETPRSAEEWERMTGEKLKT